MADIRCPNCKQNNPDFLDVCQFCQTPLKPESMVHIGEKPTKKGTGELENDLPEWLRDMRQQSRQSADEEAAQTASQRNVQKNEEPDLLAGLASQTKRAEEDDVPDWLSSINPIAKQKPLVPATPEPETDFFAQFNKPASEPPAAPAEKPSEQNAPSAPSQTPADKDELSAWFSQAAQQPSEPVSLEPDTSQTELGWMNNFDSPGIPAQTPAPKAEEDLSWLRDLEASSKQTGDLDKPKQDTGWTPNIQAPSSSGQPPSAPDDLSWLNDLGGISAPTQPAASQPSAPKEDLSWLDNLGRSSEPSQPSQPSASVPKEDLGWLENLDRTQESAPPSSQSSSASAPKEDLSWLSNLGGTSEPLPPPTPQPSAPKEDLSWLQNLGEPSESAPSTPAQSASSFDTFGQDKLSTSSEDLSWLQDLGEPSEPAPSTPAQSAPTSSSFETFAQDTPAAAREDMDWLQKLGEESQPISAARSEPTPPVQDEPDWLKNRTEQDTPASADILPPSHTAPLSEETEQFTPDWLKSATEQPSQPSMPMGVEALDQFRDKYQPPAENLFDWLEPVQESLPAEEEPLLPASPPEPATIDSSLFSPASDSASLSNQDVDSLLSMEMPDWLSRPDPGASEVTSQETPSRTVEEGETLAPVELPSWVQAMRPVEAVVSENAATTGDQLAEQEGPLAGLRGLIPTAPIGSAQRPKPISLKLQATDEQQAGAALLEQILASETAPRAAPAESVMLPQNVLRWALSALLLIVLGSMIVLRTQAMPVSPGLPAAVSAASSAVANIPENSPVLVVIDYEPALAGEMEAISGPLLDQIVLLRHPRLSFLSTSPNGSALAERLMTSTNINQPSPAGLGYTAGEHYFNLGYLPGGAAGVLEFVESPKTAMPSATVERLSEFSAVVVLTDHAESGRMWVEQLAALKQVDPVLTNQHLLVVSSAQAGPLLQPYVSSGQITGMVSGLSDAATYEFVNNSRPGIARNYWDTFGVGLMTAIAAIMLGSLWGLVTGLRARRSEAEQG
jgi:hypothetical protein